MTTTLHLELTISCQMVRGVILCIVLSSHRAVTRSGDGVVDANKPLGGGTSNSFGSSAVALTPAVSLLAALVAASALSMLLSA